MLEIIVGLMNACLLILKIDRIALKFLSAALTTVTCIISLIWYFLDPNILTTPKAWVFIINLIMLAAAGIAGHIGGKLVFKE